MLEEHRFTVNTSDPNAVQSLLNAPLALPPPGVTANFENPIWYGEQAIIAGAVSLPILLLFLLIRTYVKAIITRRITFDDYIYWVSWPAGVAFIALSMALMKSSGYGYHAWDIQLKDFIGTERVARALAILQGPLLWLMKLTLFSLIFNSFQDVRWIKALVYTGVIASFIVFIPSGVISGHYCESIFDPSPDIVANIFRKHAFECVDPAGIVGRYNLALGVFNAFIDFYILLIPLPCVYSLRMPRLRKIGIYGIFLAGLGACVCSVISLRYRIRQTYSSDVTYNLVSLSTVNIIEVCVGLMIPCASSIAQLYHSLAERFLPMNRRIKMSKSDPGRWAHSNTALSEDMVQLKDEGALLSRQESGGNSWTWYSRTRLGTFGSQTDTILPLSELRSQKEEETVVHLQRPPPPFRKWSDHPLESVGTKAFREDMRG